MNRSTPLHVVMRVQLLFFVLLSFSCAIYAFTTSSFGSSLRNRYRAAEALNMATPKAVPPNSFLGCVVQAKDSVRSALNDGYKLIEVEFPPLPLDYLEDSASSARDIADANTRWAVEFAKSFVDLGKVSVIYPDQPELDDAVKFVEAGTEKVKMDGLNPFPNVTLATCRTDSITNARSLDQLLLSVFGATVGGTVEPIPNTKLYVAVVSSTQELPDLEKLHNMDPSIPIVFFNLRLDILRGDLGLPLFPGRDLHHRFLCRVKPAYFMKSRSFATSLKRPPFIVNFSGLQFRAYPEQFQSILNTGAGKNKLVNFGPDRPTNLDFRNNLSGSLIIQNVPREELIVSNGNLVWWEKELDKEASADWRL